MTAVIGAVLAVAFGVFLFYLFIIWPARAIRGTARTVHRVVSPEAQARFEIAKETEKAQLTTQGAAEPAAQPAGPLTKTEHLDAIKALYAQKRALPKPSPWGTNADLRAQHKTLNAEIRDHYTEMDKTRQNGSAS